MVGCMPHDKAVIPEPKSKTFGGIKIFIEREDVSGFVYDLKILRQVTKSLDDNSLRKNTIIKELAKVYSIVDMIPAETGEASWRPKLEMCIRDRSLSALRPLRMAMVSSSDCMRPRNSDVIPKSNSTNRSASLKKPISLRSR